MLGNPKGPDAGASAAEATAATHSAIQLLRHKLEHQALLLRGMWALVKLETGRTDDDLARTIRKIEQAEKKHAKEAVPCGDCGRNLQDNSNVCVYCGAVNEHRPLF